VKRVWTISFVSESSDDYGPYLFDREPTEEELRAFVKTFGDDAPKDADGPGIFGSYLHVESKGWTDVNVLPKAKRLKK